MNERRRHPRASLSGKTVLVTPCGAAPAGTYRGEIHDLSVRGIRCRLDFPSLPAGAAAVIEFRVPTRLASRRLRLSAELLRSDEAAAIHAFGLCAPEASRELNPLRRFVVQAVRARAGAAAGRLQIDRRIEEALGMVLAVPRTDARGPRILMVTSPLPEDGARFVAARLAAVLGRRGESVIAVDADRSDEASGPVPVLGPSAALVASLRTAGAAYAVITAPAVLAASGAGALSAAVDDVLLVLRSGVSTQQHAADALALLRRHGGANVRGAVLTEHADLFDAGARSGPALADTTGTLAGAAPAAEDAVAAGSGASLWSRWTGHRVADLTR